MRRHIFIVVMSLINVQTILAMNQKMQSIESLKREHLKPTDPHFRFGALDKNTNAVLYRESLSKEALLQKARSFYLSESQLSLLENLLTLLKRNYAINEQKASKCS